MILGHGLKSLVRWENRPVSVRFAAHALAMAIPLYAMLGVLDDDAWALENFMLAAAAGVVWAWLLRRRLIRRTGVDPFPRRRRKH
jgi:hypothetical protein